MLETLAGWLVLGAVVFAGAYIATRRSGDRARDSAWFGVIAVVVVFALLLYKNAADCFPCGTYSSGVDSINVPREYAHSSESKVTYNGHCTRLKQVRRRFGPDTEEELGERFEVSAQLSNVTADGFVIAVKNDDLPACVQEYRAPRGQTTYFFLNRSAADRQSFNGNSRLLGNWPLTNGLWKRRPPK